MTSFLPSLSSASVDPERIGRVRVLVVGNAGCGKTSLAHFLACGLPLPKSAQTVGCNTFVKLVEYPEGGPELGSASSKPYFVELWDIGANERYRSVRSVFYNDINGVLLVHDLTHLRSEASVHRWAKEVAHKGTFSAAYGPEEMAANVGGLPVPCLIVGNKCDKARGHGGVARRRLPLFDQLLDWLLEQWHHFKFRRKTGNLSRASSSWPHLESAGTCSSISASALQGKIDLHAVDAFFHECIARRYYLTSPPHTANDHELRAGGQVRTTPSSSTQRRSPSLTGSAPAAAGGPPAPALAPAPQRSLMAMFQGPAASPHPSTLFRPLARAAEGPYGAQIHVTPGAGYLSGGHVTPGGGYVSGPDSNGHAGPPSAWGSNPRVSMLSRSESHLSVASSISDYGGGGENGYASGHAAPPPSIWPLEGNGRIDDDLM